MTRIQHKHALSFSNLPKELRLKIWETAIRSPKVYRIQINFRAQIKLTSSLIQSTATARAALSVSRTDRALILQHILPNEIPLSDMDSPFSVVRYNAAKDIICLAWPTSTIHWDLVFCMARTFDAIMADNMMREKAAWMTKVQKLALEPGFEATPTEGTVRNLAEGLYKYWFSGWKQLYIVIPQPDEMPDEDIVVEELPDPQNSSSQEMPEETTLEMFMRAEYKAPALERNDDAFLHTGTYGGTRSADTYLSGTAALDWLRSRRNKTAFIQKVEEYNESRAKLHKDGLMPDMKVGILLHVVQDVQEVAEVTAELQNTGEISPSSHYYRGLMLDSR